MAEQEQETPPANDGLAEKVDKLEDKISQIFDMLKGGGSGDRGSETEPQRDEASVSAEVRRELDKLQREEQARQREAERDAKVGELSEKVASIPERAPREYRKATNFMGWATQEDR